MMKKNNTPNKKNNTPNKRKIKVSSLSFFMTFVFIAFIIFIQIVFLKELYPGNVFHTATTDSNSILLVNKEGGDWKNNNQTNTNIDYTTSSREDEKLKKKESEQKQDEYYLRENGIEPRAFPIWPYEFPCFEPEKAWFRTDVVRSPASEGFLFVKEMKTGSSTLTGVTLRIAQKMAQRLNNNNTKNFPICKSRFDHSMAGDLKYYARNRKKSFLWTVIREPNKRATSQFFHFEVSRNKEEPSDENFKKYLSHTVFHDYYLRSLNTGGYNPEKGEPKKVVKRIVNDYDFIGITERMDESLVVLSILLDLELQDILYLSAKGNGGFDDGRFEKKCVYIVPPYVSPSMKAWFQEDKEWKRRTKGDQLLYKAAMRSLDMTIDALGRDEVMKKLAEFQKLRQYVETECKGKVLYPCDAGGKRLGTNVAGCLWNDSGCGNKCLDNATSFYYDK